MLGVPAGDDRAPECGLKGTVNADNHEDGAGENECEREHRRSDAVEPTRNLPQRAAEQQAGPQRVNIGHASNHGLDCGASHLIMASTLDLTGGGVVFRRLGRVLVLTTSAGGGGCRRSPLPLDRDRTANAP